MIVMSVILDGDECRPDLQDKKITLESCHLKANGSGLQDRS